MTQASSLGDNALTLVTEYCELVKLKKEIEAKIKALDPEVKPMLVGKGNLLVGERFTIECKQSKGRTTLDKPAMIAAGITLERYEKVGAPFVTTTVKMING